MSQILFLIPNLLFVPPGFPPGTNWICLKSAFWITVHEFQSSSYSNYIEAFIVGLIIFSIAVLQANPAKEGTMAMVKRLFSDFFRKVGGVAVLVFLVFTAGQIIYNFIAARNVFVVHRPFVNVFWNQNTEGLEVPRGVVTTIDPEFRRTHRQYVAKVYYPPYTPTVHPDVEVLFEFPYFVSTSSLSGDNCSEATFRPVFNQSLLILPGSGTITVGPQSYRTWKLHIPYMNAGGYVRLVVTFDIAHDAETAHDPLDDYVKTTTTFLYGHRNETNETYAPFEIEPNGTIKLQPSAPMPHNLRVESYMY